MEPYHKIQTVFFRDPENNHKTLLDGQFSKPEFELLQDIDWAFTEKIDGTNIRIHYDGNSVSYGGRTDRAHIPPQLLEHLQTLDVERLKEGLSGPATLYGEGFGAGIQKGGGNYCSSPKFILFDVFCGMWLERNAVEGIAKAIGIPFAPVSFYGTLDHGLAYCASRPCSEVAETQDTVIEGFVMRPRTELLNRKGERIISKIKCKDFG